MSVNLRIICLACEAKIIACKMNGIKKEHRVSEREQTTKMKRARKMPMKAIKIEIYKRIKRRRNINCINNIATAQKKNI